MNQAGFLPGGPVMPVLNTDWPELPPLQDYERLKPIGRGSYGEVWLVRGVVGTLRAVKVVWRRTFWDSHPYEREFRGIQRFEPISRSHEGLVHVLHVGRNDAEGCFYYIMELADHAQSPDADPHSALRTAPNSMSDTPRSALPTPHSYVPRTLASEVARGGRLPVSVCVEIGARLAAALEHLHRNKLVHRDIKPANIIFVGGAPKLADIGLVAEFAEARSYVGTEGFIPPEGPGTVLADLYSLGKLLYEISTGKDRHAFPELPHDLAEQTESERLVELNAVLLRACQPDPRDRYASAAAMQADLESVRAGVSIRRRYSTVRPLVLARRVAEPAGRAMRRVVALFQPEPPRSEPVVIEKGPTQSREAFGAYLIGKSSLNQRDAPGTERAIECFKRAIELDPQFAGAYADLARAYLWKNKAVDPANNWARQAAAAVEEAMRLNPNLAEAYMTRGELAFTPLRQWDFLGAIHDQLRALQLKPGLTLPRENLAFVCYHCGLLDEARHELEHTLELDPGNHLAHTFMGQILVYLGKPQEAFSFFVDLPKQSWLRGWQASLCLIYLDQTKEAAQLLAHCLEHNPGDPAMLSVEAMLAAMRGDAPEANRKIEAALRHIGLVHFHHVTYQVASAYALMEQPVAALEWLEKSAADGFPCYPFFKLDRHLIKIRGDPRFAAFLARQEKDWQRRRHTILKLLQAGVQ